MGDVVMKFIRKYLFAFFMVLLLFGLYITNKKLGLIAFNISFNSLKEMIIIIPPIFILMGLLDEWVPKEVMTKHMGEESGIKGVVLSFIFGSVAAGPLYGAFPIASVFMKKGVRFSNILIFIGAWSTTKIPMLLFEITALGYRFTITRLFLDIIGIVLISKLIERMIKNEEVNEIYIKNCTKEGK